MGLPKRQDDEKPSETMARPPMDGRTDRGSRKDERKVANGAGREKYINK